MARALPEVGGVGALHHHLVDPDRRDEDAGERGSVGESRPPVGPEGGGPDASAPAHLGAPLVELGTETNLRAVLGEPGSPL